VVVGLFPYFPVSLLVGNYSPLIPLFLTVLGGFSRYLGDYIGVRDSPESPKQGE